MESPAEYHTTTPEAVEFSASALTLLHTAEQLIAEQGIDGVSSREIARRAGQKNHSAVNYNFGSFEGLVEALIHYRVGPVNRRREQQLARLQAEGNTPDLRDLVDLMIRPLAEELLQPAGHTHYLSLLAQLLPRPPWRELFMRNRARSGALREVSALAEAQLQHLPRHIRQERLRLLGGHIVQVVAEWDTQRRSGERDSSPAELTWRLDDFIRYSLAGLCAPAPGSQ
ncbi:TetR/AcrR family transcriptional regulator [Parahaliea aestuarii]|uniref:Helix-turn-helix transcriptional regulator n=1 Tax=Parahaliea aestuarii TaxID=1852021 RepID=A0A5C9A3P8_9GAMM|nr:TetR/AcrR family transcriptional regulator [Parahaliea aestuarii]TXS94562.1 helix-turn-helix transcriptional regulator [Parahaliea aestuarii]